MSNFPPANNTFEVCDSFPISLFISNYKPSHVIISTCVCDISYVRNELEKGNVKQSLIFKDNKTSDRGLLEANDGELFANTISDNSLNDLKIKDYDSDELTEYDSDDSAQQLSSQKFNLNSHNENTPGPIKNQQSQLVTTVINVTSSTDDKSQIGTHHSKYILGITATDIHLCITTANAIRDSKVVDGYWCGSFPIVSKDSTRYVPREYHNN